VNTAECRPPGLQCIRGDTTRVARGSVSLCKKGDFSDMTWCSESVREAEFSGNLAKCERLPGWTAHHTARGAVKHTTMGEGDIEVSSSGLHNHGDAFGIDVEAS